MSGERAVSPLSCDEATDLFRAFEAGIDAAVDCLGEVPLLAIEVTSRDVSRLPSPPLHFPGVVVAVARDNETLTTAPACDLALMVSGSPPPSPWVGVDSSLSAFDTLADNIAASPVAAVTLVQLLRCNSRLSVEAGLVLESLAYSTLQSGAEFATWVDRRRAERGASERTETVRQVLVERIDDVVRVTLNRPEVHNAYNTAMRDALTEVLAAVSLDPSARIVLDGNGPSFCSGGDLGEFATSPNPAVAHLVRTRRSPARLLARMPSRVTAVVHGYCAGSGIELAAFASVVLAREEVTIWLPELAMGLIPGAGGTVSLPRRIGAGRTAWLALSGARLDTATAISWGLLDGWAQGAL